MTAAFDLVVRNGTVHDGTGAPPVGADVGVRDGRIAAVAEGLGAGEEEIDATDRIVTPGFVDIHTHYDAQAVWSHSLAPSAWHGVTTVIMGNCGVGFAPCRPDDREVLIALMEGVEDIPGPVMHEGLTWAWETFPQYLDVLDGVPRDVDVGALLPHAPLRLHVMGERARRREPATAGDLARMRAIVGEALDAGAFGVSSSRTTSHRSVDGELTPTLAADADELRALMGAVAGRRHGFFEIVTELRHAGALADVTMLRDLAGETGVSTYFTLLQNARSPELWRALGELAAGAANEGIPLRPVVAPRPVGMMLGLDSSYHPFAGTRTYQHELARLPLAERVERMRRPDVRARVLADDPLELNAFPYLARIPYSNHFAFGDPPDYTPPAYDSIAAAAAREGRDPAEVAYDALLADRGHALLYVPIANYVDGSTDACAEMLADRNAIMGLGDGGAHVGFILDAGFPTYLLAHWVRDTGTFALEEGVRRLTSDTAAAAGLRDRGRIAVGLRADLNVIDVDRLHAGRPYVAFDLPLGGRRLLQRAQGYDATLVAGEVTYRSGEPTGARPGRLVRSVPR